jgi:DNA ligase (NAD+)
MNLEAKLTHELVNLYYVASYAYYELEKSPLTDAQFDALCALLVQRYDEIDPADQDVIPLTALQAGTGYQLFGRYPHWVKDQLCTIPSEEKMGVRYAVPMLSLDNAFNEADVQQFMQRVNNSLRRTATFVCEPKVDGLSITLRYAEGQLSIVSTRGNGLVGENVTHNSLRMQGVPHTLPEPISVEIRGEAYISKSDWEAYLVECERNDVIPMANPRNAVSGTMRRVQARGIRPKISFVAYRIVTWPGGTQAEILTQLRQWGFVTPMLITVTQTIEGVMQYVHALAQQKDKLPYEIDGVVVKVNALEDQELLAEGTSSPRWGISYKYPEEIVTSKIWAVTERTGRTGRVTPVAMLEPTRLGGVMVTMANLHNYELMDQMGLKPGTVVEIKRAGEVIPAVVGVVHQPPEGELYQPVTHCPSCNTLLERSGKYTLCPNKDGCPAQCAGQLIYFCSRSGLDIDGIGPRLIERLMDTEALTHYLQFFDDAMEGRLIRTLGERMAAKIMRNINAARSVPLGRFLGSIGIPTVAEELGRALANHFLTLDAFAEATVEQLREVDGIDGSAERIHAWVGRHLRYPGGATAALSMRGLMVMPAEVTDMPLKGRTLAITGSFNRFERRELSARLRQLGAVIGETITGKCELLVVGQNARSKLQKAQALNIPTLEEDGDLSEQLQAIKDMLHVQYRS